MTKFVFVDHRDGVQRRELSWLARGVLHSEINRSILSPAQDLSHDVFSQPQSQRVSSGHGFHEYLGVLEMFESLLVLNFCQPTKIAPNTHRFLEGLLPCSYIL